MTCSPETCDEQLSIIWIVLYSDKGAQLQDKLDYTTTKHVAFVNSGVWIDRDIIPPRSFGELMLIEVARKIVAELVKSKRIGPDYNCGFGTAPLHTSDVSFEVTESLDVLIPIKEAIERFPFISANAS